MAGVNTDVIQEYDWSDEQILELICEIEQMRFMWDPRDKDKKNKKKKLAAFKHLAIKFNVTIDQVRRKYLILLQAYRNCRRKISRSKNTYTPVWFAFEPLHKFLKDVYKPHRGMKMMKHEDNDDDDISDLDADFNQKRVVLSNVGVRQNLKRRKIVALQAKKKLQLTQPSTNLTVNESSSEKGNKESQGEVNQRDECDIFGELIAVKLRKMNEVTRQYVMNDINNLIFQEMIKSHSQASFANLGSSDLSSIVVVEKHEITDPLQ